MKNKPETRSSAPNEGAATRFVESLLRQGQVTFNLGDLVERSGLSRIAARHQLLRLGNRVVRVAPRQEFFLVVSPEHQIIGAPPAAWWLDAYFRWLGRPYYLALLSAAAEYGAAPQALQVVQVITDKPRRPLRLGRVRVEFRVKRDIAVTPVQPLASAYAPLLVSTRAATALDLVRYGSSLGGMQRVTQTLVPLLRDLRRAELTTALKVEREVATIQRFGLILEILGYSALADLAHEFLPDKVNKVLLDTGPGSDVSMAGGIGRRWATVVNTRIAEP